MHSAWQNWTGDQRCRPATIERPSGPAEVTAALERAVLQGLTVRAVGSGHSFSEVALTDGMLLSLERMDRVIDVDRTSGLVRAEGGISLRALSQALAGHGLALENLGDVDTQSIAGATATGTHGTGARLPNLSAGLHALELVLADGSTLEVDAARQPDAWRAALVSLGSLGVVTAVTLRTVPAFTLLGIDAPAPLEETLDRLDQLADENDHFELFTFPHSPLALTRTNNRVDQPPRPPSRAAAYLRGEVLNNQLFGALCRVGRRYPRAIPAINRAVSRLAGTTHRLDESWRVFSSPRLIRFTEMEYAIPRRAAAAAVRAVRDAVVQRGFAVSFPIELRFGAADEAFLSPACERETAYVAVHMYQGMEWEPYFRAVEEIMLDLQGRPHWGKRHFRDARSLAASYPAWERFQDVRAQLDPHGRFQNGYTERVLGPLIGEARP